MRRRTRNGMWSAALLACLLLPSCATAPAPSRPTVVTRPRPATAWPRREILDLALRAYQCGQAKGEISQPILTVIDYSMPSTSKRLWVIDLTRRKILFNELVAHGVNSGDTYPSAFSNVVGSRQTSLGLFRTDEPYYGRHGLSLRLSGLETGVNDKARERAIVMHGAPYVSDATVSTYGRLGRSWGCPALPEHVNRQVIDRIQYGSAVFAYYPDRQWLRTSRYLNNCDTRWARQG